MNMNSVKFNYSLTQQTLLLDQRVYLPLQDPISQMDRSAQKNKK